MKPVRGKKTQRNGTNGIFNWSRAEPRTRARPVPFTCSFIVRMAETGRNESGRRASAATTSSATAATAARARLSPSSPFRPNRFHHPRAFPPFSPFLHRAVLVPRIHPSTVAVSLGLPLLQCPFFLIFPTTSSPKLLARIPVQHVRLNVVVSATFALRFLHSFLSDALHSDPYDFFTKTFISNGIFFFTHSCRLTSAFKPQL